MCSVSALEPGIFQEFPRQSPARRFKFQQSSNKPRDMDDVLLRELGTPFVVKVHFFEPLLERTRSIFDSIAFH